MKYIAAALVMVLTSMPAFAQTSRSDAAAYERLNRLQSSKVTDAQVKRLLREQQRRNRAQAVTQSLQGTPSQVQQRQRSVPVQNSTNGLYRNEQ